MLLQFICVVAESVLHFFLLLNKIPVYGYVTFIHSSIEEHLSCFYLWTIMSNAAVNIYAQVFYVYACFHFSWVYTTLETAGLHGNSV